MPRINTLGQRRLWRQLRLSLGAAADKMDETAFRIRRRPRGFAHKKAEYTASQIEQAIVLGVRFLYEQQRSDGSLRGFLLYPGASTTWLTAHVAFIVEEVTPLKDLCRKAADFLHAVGAEDGGWGFNRRVAVDCDSSAQALLVLQRFEKRIENFLLQNLIAAQHPCGGFPTYRPTGPDGMPVNGWQVPHPEVSAVVAELLRRLGSLEHILSRCSEWLKSCLVSGILPSYWWCSEHYGLWIQARTGLLTANALPIIEAALQQPLGSPQIPMAITAAVYLAVPEEVLRQGVQRLLAEQYVDGSWPCLRCLRVTSQKCFDSRPVAPGPILGDRRRVLSTAHSVAALFELINKTSRCSAMHSA